MPPDTDLAPSSQELPQVLCLDANERMLEVLAKILTTLPVQCFTTTRPPDALEMLRSRPVRLLILDWHLRPLVGWEVLRAARAVQPQTTLRVMLLGATEGGFEELLALNIAGADAFLDKPVEPETLCREVMRLLNLPPARETPHV
jgi:DNA-binding response OmpR family regulator